MDRKWLEDQEAALKFEKGKDMIVFASAGSGKTTVMVEKIVRYLAQENSSIMKIIVLTFTNNSASDMQTKILDEIKKRIMKETDASLIEHLRKQIIDLPLAYIGTIDSFCNTIVQKHYESIGINPGLSVLSAAEAEQILDETIEEIFEEKIKMDEPLFKLAATCFSKGRDISKIRDIIKEINFKLGASSNPKEDMAFLKDSCSIFPLENRAIKVYIEKLKKEAKELKNQIDTTKRQYPLYETNKKGEVNDLNCKYEKLDTMVSALLATEDSILSLSKVIIDLYKEIPEKLAAADFKNADTRKAYNELLKDYSAFLNTVYFDFGEGKNTVKIEEDSRNVVKIIVDLAEEVISRFEEKKAADNKMTFSDIERFALQILSSNEGPEEPSKIAQDIARDIDYIFFDEYQDTNELQDKIIKMVARKNIFMVGDIKQSIYMFRNSDPDIMKNKRETFSNSPEEGKIIDLNYNFRSHKDILDFVNEVFSSVMSNDFGKVNYKKEAMMTPFEVFPEEANSLKPIVTIKLFENTEKVEENEEKTQEEDEEKAEFQKIYSIRNAPIVEKKDNAQAKWIADTILSIVGKKTIYDKKKAAFRMVEFKDIVLLQRNRKVEPYAEAFKIMGIPYESAGTDNALSTNDIEILNSLLRVISNPRLDYPLALVLASFFGKFSLKDMLNIRKNRIDSVKNNTMLSEEEKKKQLKEESLYDAVSNLEGEIGVKAKSLLNLINKYREESYLIDVPSLLMKIVTETGYDAEMLSGEDERISSFNIYTEFLRGKEFASNIENYLRWVDKDQKIEVSLPSSGANCVKIDTIHASKGLEYPIVFLCEADQGFKKARITSNDILIDKEYGIAAKYVDISERKLVETLNYISVYDRIQEREKEEQLRILYVALTRAQNKLYITGAPSKKATERAESDYVDVTELNSLLELIIRAAKTSVTVKDKYNNSEPEDVTSLVSGEVLPEMPLSYDAPKLEHHKYLYEPSTKINNKYTVTQISSSIDNMGYETQEKYEHVQTMMPFSQEEGTLYHKIMEKIDIRPQSKEEVSRRIDELYKEGLTVEIPREQVDDEIIFKAVNNPLFLNFQTQRIEREKSFILYLPYSEIAPTSEVADKVVVQGVIDLLAFGKNKEVTLVDYKLSMSSPETIKTRYAEQIAVYALAVEKILRCKVTKKVIYILGQDKIVEI